MPWTRPLLFATALVAAVTASVRRRRAQVDSDNLWREATADASD